MKQFENIVYPMAFHSPGIVIHSDCQAELRSLIERSGKKGQFAAAFVQRLNFLLKHRENAISHLEWFEKMKYVDDLFAMRFVRIDNIRIPYVITANGIYLLHAFKETSSGNGPNSYRHAAQVALKRIKDIDGGANNG